MYRFTLNFLIRRPEKMQSYDIDTDLHVLGDSNWRDKLITELTIQELVSGEYKTG